MRKIRTVAVAGVLVGGMAVAFHGCGANITPNMTVSQALQAIAQNPLLSQVTVGDIVQGFRDFAGGMHQQGMQAAPLSADQQQQLQELQSQLSAGQISQTDFESQVQSIIGDMAPGVAFAGFGFFGSPFGHHFHGPLTGDLALTADQMTQAKTIFQSAHDDIAKLRSDAHLNVFNNVLTAEQQTKLQQLVKDHPFLDLGLLGPPPSTQPMRPRPPMMGGFGGGPGGFAGGGEQMGGANRGPIGGAGEDEHMGGVMGGPMGGGGGEHMGGPMGVAGEGEHRGGPIGVAGGGPRGLIADLLAQALDLTADQKTQIEKIRSDLRDAVKARHDLARTQFEAILTPEQLAALQAFEDHFHPPVNAASTNG